MKIRELKALDAEKFAHLTQQVEGNSEYTLWEGGERDVQIEQQLKIIERIEQKGNSTILVTEKDNNKSVRFLVAAGDNAKRNKHAAYIVIGIFKGL